MSRPTLLLSFVVLFLTLGPVPSQQCSKRGDLHCFVCGGRDFNLGDDQFSRQVSDNTVWNKAVDIPCGSAGTLVNCSQVDTLRPNQKWVCAKAVTRTGSFGRKCFRVEMERKMQCDFNNGATFCACDTNQCNSSPSMRQKKYGPLSAVGLAHLVAYFGFHFNLARLI